MPKIWRGTLITSDIGTTLITISDAVGSFVLASDKRISISQRVFFSRALFNTRK